MKTRLPSLLLPLLFASSLSAAPIIAVDWGGTELTPSTQAMTLTGESTQGNYRTWHATTTALTSGVASYSGQPIYGILQNATSGGAANFERVSLYHNASGDYISVRGPLYDIDNPIERTISGLLYVGKSDFLNGLDSASPLRFATNGALSVDVRQLNAGGTRFGRMAILNDGIWYLSQSLVGGVSTFTINDPTSVNWAAWDPSGTPLASTPGTFSILGSSFQNIEAFGFYFTNSQPSGSDRQPIFEISRMSASFEVIPEPSTLLCLVMGGGFLAFSALRNYRNRVS